MKTNKLDWLNLIPEEARTEETCKLAVTGQFGKVTIERAHEISSPWQIEYVPTNISTYLDLGCHSPRQGL